MVDEGDESALEGSRRGYDVGEMVILVSEGRSKSGVCEVEGEPCIWS